MMTREEARAAGEPFYFTGEKCKTGHISERVTSTGVCVACLRSKALVGRSRAEQDRPQRPLRDPILTRQLAQDGFIRMADL